MENRKLEETLYEYGTEWMLSQPKGSLSKKNKKNLRRELRAGIIERHNKNGAPQFAIPSIIFWLFFRMALNFVINKILNNWLFQKDK